MYTYETYKFRPDKKPEENSIPEIHIRQLTEMFIDGMFESFGRYPDNADYSRFEHLYAGGHLMLCVVKRDNLIIGVALVEVFATWRNKASEIFRLTEVYVRPGYRKTAAAYRLYEYTNKEMRKYADAAKEQFNYQPRLLTDIDTNDAYESLVKMAIKFGGRKIAEVWEADHGK